VAAFSCRGDTQKALYYRINFDFGRTQSATGKKQLTIKDAVRFASAATKKSKCSLNRAGDGRFLG
jgi:hypothetical protein